MVRVRLLCILGLLAVLSSSQTALAQRRAPGYSSRPTISPYFNLFQANNGGLNSYFSFVRPRQQMNQFMQDVNRRESLQAAAVQYETRELERSLANTIEGTAKQLNLRPTPGSAYRKNAGQFMNYSAFYPQGNSAPMRRR